MGQTAAESTVIGADGKFQLALTLEKTVFTLGEQVNITVKMTNISGQTVDYTQTIEDFDFQVYDDSNNPVYKSAGQVAMAIVILHLSPGESRSQNFAWLQTCNNTATECNVPAGTYYVIGQKVLSGLQTPPIQITIVKP